jgi:hypothetical protein
MQQPIDLIATNLFLFLNPDIVIPGYQSEVQSNKGPHYNENVVKKYQLLLSAIKWFLKKLSRYPKIFTDFYPPNETEIPQYEALQHHVHAYLEDSETLKNKLTYLIGSLKNDLQPFMIEKEKEEMRLALDFIKSEINRVFEQVSSIRGDHRHAGFIFSDCYVTDAEAAKTLLNTPELKKFLTEKGLNGLQEKEKTSLAEGKKFWKNTAEKNFEQVSGLTNEVIERIDEFIYVLLDIKPLEIEKTDHK